MTLILAALTMITQVQAKGLSLEGYLQQVNGKNKTVLSQKNVVAGIDLRKEEGDLLVAPQLIASSSLSRDATPIFAVFLGSPISSAVVNKESYSLGVTQQLRFGLNYTLGYNFIHTTASGITVGGVAVPVDIWQLQPKLDVKFPLWKNLFGKDTTYQLNIAESSAMISQYSERLKLKSSLLDAENAYWKLVIARQVVEVRKELLGRAQALQVWAKKRTEASLGDRADLLQADAISELRQLELDSAMNDLRTSSIVFNTTRGIDSMVVKEELDDLPIDEGVSLGAPKKVGERDDYLIAIENEKISRQTSLSSIEKSKPSLDLTGTVALNGANTSFANSFSQSTSTSNPLTTVGISLTAPLDFSLVGKIQEGREKEKLGAEWLLEAKRFEQDQEWKDLVLKFEESKKKVKLATAIEKIQREKLIHERDRLSRGRTTTNLVIQFEQDYSQSLLNKILTQQEVIQIYSKMKLLSGASLQEALSI